MKISVVYNETQNCLIGKMEGLIKPEDLTDYLEEVLDKIESHNCRRLLTDLRTAELQLSLADLYYASADAIQGKLDRTWRRAIVVKKMNRDSEFYQITASNKGVTIRVFESMEEAFAWL